MVFAEQVRLVAEWWSREPETTFAEWKRECERTFGSEPEEALRIVKAAHKQFLEARGQMRLL